MEKDLIVMYGGSGDDTLLGSDGNDQIYGGDGNDTLQGGAGDDYLNGQIGDDTLTGGAGKDMFVYYLDRGDDTVTDYTAGEDTVEFTKGWIQSTSLVNNGKDVKYQLSAGSITVQDGSEKTISIKDSRGSYTASKTEITLGSDFGGTLDAGAYLDTVQTIDGSAVSKAVTLKGNANANVMYGGSANDKLYGYGGNDQMYGGAGKDTLQGGVGDDYLNGQAGDDTLTGGAGRDTFAYADGDGNDTVTDYAAGEDTVEFTNGQIQSTTLVNSGTDVKYQLSSGSITVKKGAGKTISIEDSRGSYTASKKAIMLGSDFGGTLDAGAYLDTVQTIDGSAAAQAVTLKGNANANVMYGGAGNDMLEGNGGNDQIYGGDGNDTLEGGAGDDYLNGQIGDDTLTGGAGNDTFVYYLDRGDDTVTDYTAGEDTVEFTKGWIQSTSLVNDGKDVKYQLSAGSITVEDGSEKTISVKDSRGSYTASNTEITLGSGFGGTLDAGAYLDTVQTIDGSAVSKAVTLKGNANANVMYGGSANDKLYGYGGNDQMYGGAGKDTLQGGAGDDYLNGQAGDDTLTGGAGRDTFAYADGDGNDTVTDYAAGEDTVEFTNGQIQSTSLVNSGKDVKYQLSAGSITVKKGAGKTISIEDSRGSYTASKKAIMLGSDFGGTLDAGTYLDTVQTIDGTAVSKAVTLKGNANANVMYGGAGNDTLYGYGGNDQMYGGDGNDTLEGGAGDDYLNGQIGDDTLTGGAGNDTFVYYPDRGDDTVTDYTAGEDTVEFTGGQIQSTSLVNNGTDVKYQLSAGSITVQDGSEKTISIKDSRGSYTASKTEITLGSGFGGTLAADAYLDTVRTIDGSAAAQAVTLKGNANANVMYGGSGNDNLYGYAGSDFLYGGAGNDKLTGGSSNDYLSGGTGTDTLTGGTGKDTFAYADGDGNDTVTDYTAGSDTIVITSGSISKTNLVSAGTDVKFTVGTGSITVANGAGKAISLEDSRGSYSVSDSSIVLGSDFTGEMNAWHYLNTVTTINGQAVDQGVTIYGNEGDNIIYGGAGNDNLYGMSGINELHGGDGIDWMNGGTGNDTLYGDAGDDVLIGAQGDDILYGGEGLDSLDGQAGDDTLYGGEGNDRLFGGEGNDSLYGGAGKDEFIYESGNDTVFDFESGNDVVHLLSEGLGIAKCDVVGNDAVLTLTNNGTITLKNMAGQTIDYIDFDGKTGSVTASVTQLDVMKNFMSALVDYPTTVASDALNSAVTTASNGLFASWDALIEQFVSDVRNYGGTSDDGKGYVVGENEIKVPEGSTDLFLKNYCGIDLTNEDTGSITGADAGGDVVKTLESIMPETGPLSDAEYPELDKVIGRLTVKWPEMDTLSDMGKTIVAGLNTYWIDAALNLVEESYGISYPDNIGFTMNVTLQDRGKGGTVASASSTSLFINMAYWENMDANNPNGKTTETEHYLDSTIAHEFTHAVMNAALYRNNPHQEGNSWVIDGPKLWNGLATDYTCLTEGLAEMTRGVDFERFNEICALAQAANADRLQNGLVTSGAYDGYAGGYMLLRYFAKQTAENFSDTLNSVSGSMMVSCDTDSISSAASLLWTDDSTAAVADTGSLLASSMTDISNAMLTPLDNLDNSVFGSDSPASDLFCDTKNNGFLG